MAAPSLLVVQRASASPNVQRMTGGTTLNGAIDGDIQTANTNANGAQGLPFGAGTFTVVSTTDFASTGTIFVETQVNGTQTVTYTGKTATTFTGCAGGVGTTPAAGFVYASQANPVTGGNATDIEKGWAIDYKGAQYAVACAAGSGVVKINRRSGGSWSTVGTSAVASSNGTTTRGAIGPLFIMNVGLTEYLCLYYTGGGNHRFMRSADGTTWTDTNLGSIGGTAPDLMDFVIYKGQFIVTGNVSTADTYIVNVAGPAGTVANYPGGSSNVSSAIAVMNNRLFALKIPNNVGDSVSFLEFASGAWVNLITGLGTVTGAWGSLQKPVLFPVTFKTTIASGSNGASLPQATINVASTTNFPSASTMYVMTSTGLQTVTYTGTTATSFTGCTGGTGTMTTGNIVHFNKLVGIFMDRDGGGNFASRAYDFIPNGTSFSAVDVSTTLLSASLRTYAAAKNDDGWLAFTDTDTDPTAPGYNLWYATGGSTGATLTYYEYINSATEMVGTLSVSPGSYVISTTTQGGGERVNTSNSDLFIYNISFTSASTAGRVLVSFRASGDSGPNNKYVRLFYSSQENPYMVQATLAGSATGGSATRNGNQIEQVNADGSTTYTFEWAAATDFQSSGQAEYLELRIGTT